jgi:hypothetical protein
MNEHGHRAYALAPLSGGGGAASASRRPDCPMCGHAGSGASACDTCGAPLTPPPCLDEPSEAFAGRRGSPRVDRVETAVWQPAPQQGGGAPMQVRMQDISFTGLSLDAMLAVPEGQIARLRAPNIDCVVEVVGCRREGSAWRVHARLLTMRLLKRAGAFVSTIA